MGRTTLSVGVSLMLLVAACGPAQTSSPATGQSSTAQPPSGQVSGAQPTAAQPTAAAPATAQATAAPAATAQSATSQPAAAQASTGQSPEWDALVQQAKQEGALTVYEGRASTRQLQDAFPIFENEFGIKVTQVAGSGDENADKVLAERNTGVYSGDIWMGGLTTINTRLLPQHVFDPIAANFVLPEVKDTSAWMKGQYWWGDPDKQYTFLFCGSPAPLVSYNTDLVNPSDITSLTDVLDPKWKGKIESRDPSASGTGGNTAYFYFSPQLGPDYLRRLFTEQDVTIVDDARQGAEWLALGKYSLYMLASGSDVSDEAAQGLPVKDMYGPFKEGGRITAGGAGSISIFNHAAHPNAAKLFVNWWLSKEGQLTAQKANPLDQSLRTDIPNDDVTPDARRDPSVDYSFLDAQPEVVAGEDN
ncbi:MAG: extracellular solute-binding protein, partial [Mycobacterium sp.]|nr:extracellular solute-binding protein [Mycobacterium sp.]